MRRLTAASFAGLALLANATAVVACPYCDIAGGELGNDLITKDIKHSDGESCSLCSIQPTTTSSTTSDSSPLRFAFAADLSSAYFRHGYMQQDRGLVIQPTLSLSLQPYQTEGWSIVPYFIWFNSIHTEESPGYAGGHGNHTNVEQQYQEYLAQPHPGTPYPHYHTKLVDVITFEDAGGGWFESTVKPGVTFINGPLLIDLNLMGCFYPTDFHDMMIEAGLRVSYDLASIGNKNDDRKFSLRFDNTLTQELIDDNGDEETVIETALEPGYRFQFGNYPTQLSLPVTTGWSFNGYYKDTSQHDEAFGYVSLGLKATVELPTDPKYGRWFINSNVTWYRMLADTAIFSNGGDEDGFEFRAGFGIAF